MSCVCVFDTFMSEGHRTAAATPGNVARRPQTQHVSHQSSNSCSLKNVCCVCSGSLFVYTLKKNTNEKEKSSVCVSVTFLKPYSHIHSLTHSCTTTTGAGKRSRRRRFFVTSQVLNEWLTTRELSRRRLAFISRTRKSSHLGFFFFFSGFFFCQLDLTVLSSRPNEKINWQMMDACFFWRPKFSLVCLSPALCCSLVVGIPQKERSRLSDLS